MFGKKAGTIVFILFFMWLFMGLVFYISHVNVQNWINKLNYRVCEVVATSGNLSNHTYEYLESQITKFGDFNITLKLEKRMNEDLYDTYYDDDEIIGKKLRSGDILTIVLEQQDMDTFSKIINAPLLMVGAGPAIDIKYLSKKVALVGQDAKDIVKGYDVIVDILNNVSDPNISIFVATKLNTIGKTYDNELYGDTLDETSQTGINHIFENGDFRREIEILPSSKTIIKYYQS